MVEEVFPHQHLDLPKVDSPDLQNTINFLVDQIAELHTQVSVLQTALVRATETPIAPPAATYQQHAQRALLHMEEEWAQYDPSQDTQ